MNTCNFTIATVLRFMLVLLFLLLMLDNILTYAGVVYSGVSESNPLYAVLGLSAFIAIKIVIAFMLPLVIYHIGKQYTRLGIGCSAFLCLLYMMIAVNNVVVMELI